MSSSPVPRAEFIGCNHPRCSLPVAKIINGSLVITTRHNGEKHQGVISLERLLQLLKHYSLTDSGKTVLSSSAIVNDHL